MFLEKVEKNRFIIPALLMIIVVVYFATQPGLFTTKVQNYDSRINLHAFFYLYDMPQFKQDALNLVSAAGIPPGYKILHYILSPFISVLVFPTIIQIICVLTVAFFAFKVGKVSLGRIGGVLSVWAFIATPFLLAKMSGGNPRAFGPPLYMAMLYYLLSNNRKGLMGVSLTAIFFYPQAMFICVVATFLKDILQAQKEGIRNFISKNKHDFLTMGVVYGLIVIVSLFIAWNTNKAGGFYTLQEVREQPTIVVTLNLEKTIPFASYPDVLISDAITFAGNKVGQIYHGKQVYFLKVLKYIQKELSNRVNKSLAIRNSEISTWGKYKNLLISLLSSFFNYFKIHTAWMFLIEWDIDHAAIMGFLLYLVVPLILYLFCFFRLPLEYVIFGISSFLLYFVATIVAFRLYDPNRFIVYPIGIMMSQFFVIGLGYASKIKDTRFNRKHAIFTIILINLLLVTFSGPGITNHKNINDYVKDREKPLFEFIEKNTNPNSIIAGKPRLMDNIPLFAKRRVLISWVLSTAWLRKINEEIAIPRLTAISEAYFADNPEPIRKLKSDFGVTHMVVDLSDFKEYPKDFELFQDIARANFENAEGNWLLKSPPKEAIVYEDQNYLLVDIDKL